MPTSPPEILTPRWRRMDDALTELRDADMDSGTAVSDAVVRALDAMYHLWEVWAAETGLRKDVSAQNATVAGHAGGETAAALVCARGANSHVQFRDFGEAAGFGEQP